MTCGSYLNIFTTFPFSFISNYYIPMCIYSRIYIHIVCVLFPGAMTGLAVAMFVTGVFFGSIIAVFYRKSRLQRPDFPYSIQD